MKRALVLLGGLVLVVGSLPVWAEDEGDPVETRLAETRAEHRMTVARALDLGPSEAPAFWKVYEPYADRMHAVNLRLVLLIENYTRSQDSMTNEKASELLTGLLAVERDRLETQQRYASELAGVISDRKRARAYQLERKFQAVSNFSFAKSIPLIE